MEMIKIDDLSVEGDTSLYIETRLQQSNNEDSVSDSNLHQLANEDKPSPDNISKENVKQSYTKKTLCRNALLICVIIIVIAVMQLPITLYAAAPSSDGMTNPLDMVDFESCLVSYITQWIRGQGAMAPLKF